MTIQAIWEEAKRHVGCLSDLKTKESRRRYPAEEDEDHLFYSCPFIRDETKVCNCKATRGAGGKTQVFSFRKSELIRGRLTHMIEVNGNSVMASDILGLNTNLVRAVALCHDMGHGPLGHPGENWVKKMMGRSDFCHEIMGVVIAQKIERSGKGLNLTWHTLRAIARNSIPVERFGTFSELQLLAFTDAFTYITADANDMEKRGKYTFATELKDLLNLFGSNQRERIDTLIASLVIESAQHGHVSFEHSEPAKKFRLAKDLMYNTVYYRVTEQGVEERMEKAFNRLKRLKIADPFLLLTLMTDNDIRMFTDHPTGDWLAFSATDVAEIVERLPEIERRHGKIDLCDPDLDW
ncbi:MAG: HD domain-containing protein [bacterium]|nr:HD domain-containing protein [bacterium]